MVWLGGGAVVVSVVLSSLNVSPSSAFQNILSLSTRCTRKVCIPLQPLFNNEVSQDGQQEQQHVEVKSDTGANANLNDGLDGKVLKLKKEAERARLEAEKMDIALTLEKIQSLESKLSNKKWLEKNPNQQESLQNQLRQLNSKLGRSSDEIMPRQSTQSTSAPASLSPSPPASRFFPNDESDQKIKENRYPKNPLSGFDDADLQVYIPVALDIEQTMQNATLTEKMQAFSARPELQDYFKKKITSMVVDPVKEVQKLEYYRSEYLKSKSRVEREQLKRQIRAMEKKLLEDDSGPVIFSSGIYCEGLQLLSDEELQQRVEAVTALPPLLQAIYKKRVGLNVEDTKQIENNKSDDNSNLENLKLAIELEHYDPQIQLLDQLRFLTPLSKEMKDDALKGFKILPKRVQIYLCERFMAQNLFADAIAIKASLEEEQGGEESISDQLIERIIEGIANDSTKNPLVQFVASAADAGALEYSDIEFLDRSKYLKEFYPNIPAIEKYHPSKESVMQLLSEVFNDSKIFMVTGPPERVLGGYYIRGVNNVNNGDTGDVDSHKLVQHVQDKLAKSSLAGKISLFYIFDPAPPAEEDIEMGYDPEPLFLVTSNGDCNEELYKRSSTLSKVGVSLAGYGSLMLFAIGSCALNPILTDKFTATLEAAEKTGVADLSWLADLSLPLFAGVLLTQLAHAAAHQVVAWKDGFKIGFPNVVPSVQLGVTGTITPLRSSPPNISSLFDFAMAGPLVGFCTSFILFLSGLDIMTTMTYAMTAQLPSVPIELIQSSSLVAGIIEQFFGKDVFLGVSNGLYQLHPLAIAGVIGCFTNALALLPLGVTDGGRISLAMFGRKGSYIANSFTPALLIIAGIFGFDKANILLLYVIYAFIFQRGLEAPLVNEVDELDGVRGAVGIFAALIVALTLTPAV